MMNIKEWLANWFQPRWDYPLLWIPTSIVVTANVTDFIYVDEELLEEAVDVEEVARLLFGDVANRDTIDEGENECKNQME